MQRHCKIGSQPQNTTTNVLNPIHTATFAYLSVFTQVYIYLGVQFLSYERNCSYGNPAHVSKFAQGQD